MPLSLRRRPVKPLSLLRRLKKAALDFILPLNCVGCKREGSALCEECVAQLPRLAPPFCRICAQPGEGSPCRRCAAAPLPINGIRAPYLMEGVVRDAVHALKYRNNRALAPVLGRLMAAGAQAESAPFDVIVPVPMHPRRLRSRGYNQAALLARELGGASGARVEEGLLVRTVYAPPQVSVGTREKRAEILSGSFAAGEAAAGISALLIDDVVTTGSTMAACAVALMDRGATEVWGLALAREG